MWDNREQERAYRRQTRAYQSPLAGLGGGIFFLALAAGLYLSSIHQGQLFLPLLFAGMGVCILLGSLSSSHPQGIYGGLHGFTWFIMLALCFFTGSWLWLVVSMGLSLIMGALWQPIMALLSGSLQTPPPLTTAPAPSSQPHPTTAPAAEEPPYQPYQEGYRGEVSRRDGQEQPSQSHNTWSSYEQPQTGYPAEPPQELPPMQQ